MKTYGMIVVAMLLFLTTGYDLSHRTMSQPSTTRMIYAGFFLSDGITPIDRLMNSSLGYFVLEGDMLIPTAVVRNFNVVPETVTVQCSIMDFSISALVYDDSTRVVLGPSADVTVKLPPWVVPIGPSNEAIETGGQGPYGSFFQKNRGDPLQPKPIGKGKCGFSGLSVQVQGNGGIGISKSVINKKAGPCPWSISFWWDNFGVNAGTKNFIDSTSGAVNMGDPPTGVSTKWFPPGPGTYCVFAVTTVQSFTALEYFNHIKIKNPPPPPIPPPPPPPPPPPGWPPLPPGQWWYLQVPIHQDSVACPDSIPIELVALQLQGSPWPFVPPKDTAYVHCNGSSAGYLSVYVPDSATQADSSVFTVIAKTPGPGGAEIGSVTFVLNPIQPGSIHGMKWEDTNGNGLKDPGEQGLPGWSILAKGDSTSYSTLTDSVGNYWFMNLAPGTYRIEEVQQVGWMQTGGQPYYMLNLAAGQSILNIDFGNFKLGQIYGMKFNDVNGNKVKDPSETGLAGWTICATGTPDSRPPSQFPTSGGVDFLGTTWAQVRVNFLKPPLDALGPVTLCASGPTTINRANPSGPTAGDSMLTEITLLELKGVLPSPLPADTFTIRHKIDRRSYGTIYGNSFPASSFFDVFFEIELPPSAGGMTLVNNDPTKMQSLINTIPPGVANYFGVQTYLVDRNNPSDTVAFIKNVNHCTKPPLCEFTCPSPPPTPPPNSIFVPQICAATDSMGNYCLMNLPPGVYTIREIQQSGWTKTVPESTYSVVITSGANVVARDFGNNTTGLAVGDEPRIPLKFALHQNYPNPFNPSTRIAFDLPKASTVTLKIYNLLGQEVETLLDHQHYEPGSHVVNFIDRNLVSGAYMYRLQANDFHDVKVMMLLK